MKKSTKILLIQFLCFALIFLAARYIITHFTLLTGLWIPIVSGVAAVILSPQFKVFKVDGKDTVFIAWLFSKKGKPVNWL